LLNETHQPTAIVNFAAESHVDRSIDGPLTFVETNVLSHMPHAGRSATLLCALSGAAKQTFRFLHVSTDEVYGSLGTRDYLPKTHHTLRTVHTPPAKRLLIISCEPGIIRMVCPILITNCSNNYGPYQFPEKLIPLMILNAIEGKPLPVYGDGLNVRDWLFVEDHCSAIERVLANGRIGECYNIGGLNEQTNLSIVRMICAVVDRLQPGSETPSMRESDHVRQGSPRP
jgi:dTDP-glucose 4,6-dehydratase